MTDQKPIPWVLKRRFLVTLLAGVGAAVMSLVIFLIANDRIILVLGGLLFICCVFRTRSIWTLISNDRYEMVEGVCSGVTSPPFGGIGKSICLTGMVPNSPCCWIVMRAFILARHTGFISRKIRARLWEILIWMPPFLPIHFWAMRRYRYQISIH